MVLQRQVSAQFGIPRIFRIIDNLFGCRCLKLRHVGLHYPAHVARDVHILSRVLGVGNALRHGRHILHQIVQIVAYARLHTLHHIYAHCALYQV